MGRNNTSKRGRLPKPKVHFSETTLTQYAGAVPLLHYLNTNLELPQFLAAAVPSEGRARKYPVHLVLYAFVVGALLGAVKLAHLEWLSHDAVVQKFVRLAGWPVRKVFSEALASVSDAGVAGLSQLLSTLGLQSIEGVTKVILDFDSTALRCFGVQEKAYFGYCGKGRNRRRHHPLVASVAETRAVVLAKYRDGSGIDESEVIAFFKAAVSRTVAALVDGATFAIRADSGFWSRAVGDWLLKEQIPFTMSMPLQAGLKLMLMKADFQPLICTEPCPAFEQDDDTDEFPDRPNDEIEFAVVSGDVVGLDARLRIIVLRRRIFDPKAPPPGKVIDWSPDWRYQAIITSTDWEALDVWRFYNGRGDAERVFKVGKHALGLGWFVGHIFRANEVAFLLRLLAWNADTLYQRHAEARASAAGRRVVRVGLQARQHYLYQLAGRLLRSGDRWSLKLPASPRVEALWNFFAFPLAATG